MTLKNLQKKQRKRRVRAKITGNSARPRLSVFRSSTKISAQLIDDQSGKTLVAVNSVGAKISDATAAGKDLAAAAKKKKIATCVFDRNCFAFAGRVKALADGARDGGLQF
jgi:large subunit ribosomal protein L18